MEGWIFSIPLCSRPHAHPIPLRTTATTRAGLLATQLLVTVALGAMLTASPAAQALLKASALPVMLAFGCVVVPLVMMMVSERARKEHPRNLVLMGIFTLGEGALVGAATLSYSTHSVLVALGITAAVTVALAVYALTTKTDFSGSGPYLYTALLALLATSIAGLLLRMPALHLAISMGGAVLFALYIVYDIQILMGGQHKVRVSPDEYVFAAINIYLDIINLFLHILRMVGNRE